MTHLVRHETLAVDLTAFAADVEALRAELDAVRGPEDAVHLRRIRRIARSCQVAGMALAWFPNPLSPVLLSLSRTIRWTCLAHHTLHRGYDKVPGLAEHETSRGFARGWRRWLDWPDVLDPDAWAREHNHLHHYRLGETHDPDVVELNTGALQRGPWPVRWLGALASMFVWKLFYYAPNNVRVLQTHRDGPRDAQAATERVDFRLLDPRDTHGRETWRRSFGPYGLWAFVAMPLLFVPLGPLAVLSALANSVVAELLTNLHTFLIVVPNHAGGDVVRFDGRPRGKAEFYVRQVAGSVNYRTGTDRIDLLHGWLNYQIEHHVFPDLTMRQYRLAQPRMQAICAAHGVPYIQQPLWRRVWRTWRVMVGLERSPLVEIVDTGAEAPAQPAGDAAA